MTIRETRRKIEKADREHLWHPFTQMKEWEQEPPLIITSGRGSFLKDINGRWYLDGVSSLWVSIHGHRKKEIDGAIKEQVDRISHSTLLGLTHPPAAELAQMLVDIAPKGLPRVFYSDSGSTAVEIALKMAFQYWQHSGFRKKKRFVYLNNSYHGDTLGAVSVGGIELFHRIFSPLLFKAFRVPSPFCYRCELGKKHPSCRMACLREAEKTMKKHHEEIAALILEPLVQGAGGMLMSPPGYLSGIRKLCTRYKVLLIADEVATGFGRTGKMFACEHEQVRPDLLCCAKGLTGGYLPLAATLATEKIYNVFLGRYEDLKTFFHGHTYTGNQLACAAAIASLRLFKKERTLKKVEKRSALLGKELDKISVLQCVGDVRQKGLMAGIEIVRDRDSGKLFPLKDKIGGRICDRAREKGLIIRPLGNVIILMPPLNISVQETKSLGRITAEAIKEVVEC